MKTVILGNLEWMSENLTGYDGIVGDDGNWYYTWNRAMIAINKIGNGWRLPTIEDFGKLYMFPSKWDDKHKGRIFDNKLFFPALHNEKVIRHNSSDYSCIEIIDMLYGHYWGGERQHFNKPYYSCFSFNKITEKPTYYSHMGEKYSVRLVRDIQKK